MSVSRRTPGGAPVSEQTMLLLPLRGRTGCRWLALAIALVVVVGAGAGASVWLGLWPAETSTRPALVETATPMQSLAQSVTVTWTAQATVEPTASHTPDPSATPVPTDTPAAPPTPTPSPTPALHATATPTASPSATLMPTPAPTRTATATPTAADPTPAGTACEPSIVSTIERAAEAQARYMEGKLDVSALAAAWGGAAAHAQTQAERMMSYRAGDIVGVEVTEVRWSVSDCRARTYDGWVQVSVSEEWHYTAQLTCASGAIETSVWSEVFPSETYALVRDADGWQIRSWRIDAPEMQRRWRCSSSE